MPTGYLVTLGDGNLDHEDVISGSQSTFTTASTIGGGSWTWSGTYNGNTYSDITDSGTYYEATNGNVYFVPSNYFISSGTAEADGVPDYTQNVEDGTVNGTSGDDEINLYYDGDVNNDEVDSGASDDDIIDAGAGNDSVDAGEGNDTVYGGTDADTILGGAGDDSIEGGDGADVIYGDQESEGAGARTALRWDEQGIADETNIATTGVTGTSSNGHVSVTTTITQEANFTGASMETTDQLYDFDGRDDSSSIELYGGSAGTSQDAATMTINFSSNDSTNFGNEVTDVSFGIFDLDELDGQFIDQVIITAYDAAGNSVAVTLTAGDASTITVDNATGTATAVVNSSGTGSVDSQTGFVLVTIAGPVAQIVIDYNNVDTAYGNHAIRVGDIEMTEIALTESTEADDIISGGDGADVIYGGEGDDTIDGGDQGDLIYGGTGNDTITSIEAAATSNDTLYGEDGNDTITVTGGSSNLLDGGADDDTLTGGTGSDTMLGGTGDDSINVASAGGVDTIEGGEDAGDDDVDTLTFTDGTGSEGVDVTMSGDEAGSYSFPTDGGSGTFTEIEEFTLTDQNDDFDGVLATGGNTVDGGAGDDVLTGSSGSDSFEGGSGSDLLNANAGDDTLSGGAGDDTIYGDEGADSIDGGADNDALYGGADNDTIDGGTGDDTIEGGSGDDTLTGGDGSDTITGGADQDVIYGGAGDVIDGSESGTDYDTLIVSGVDYIDYDDANPENGIVYFDGGGSLTFSNIENVVVSDRDGTVSGTSGNDLIDASYTGDPDGDVVDGSDAILPGDSGDDDLIEAGTGHDTVYAGEGNDEVYGGTGDDTLYGNAGDDTVFGEAGNDSIYGGTGADTLYGGTGDDELFMRDGDDAAYGGDGDDTFLVDSADGTNIVEGGEGDETDGDTLAVNASVPVNVIASGDEAGTLTTGTTTVDFSEIEIIQTGTGNDTINISADTSGMTILAEAGSDTVYGGSGDDDIYGGSGNDTLDGNAGADTLSGGAGNDTIIFSEGDSATGGSGDDLFVLEDLGETSNGAITIDGGSSNETGGDTLQLGGLASLTNDIRSTFTNDGTGSYSGSITLNDGTVLTFLEIENIICFTPNTRIATPKGLVDIQDLQVGDLVVTRDHGLQPIRWIEGRTVPARDRFAPVRIRKNVLDGQERDLIVSPQHRVLFQGYRAELLFGESEVLVAATHLVDGLDVTQDESDMVTYVHMLFDQHEVIYAEGAATESFHPGEIGFSAVGHAAREELFGIFPELRVDPRAYGSTARRCLKPHEAKLIRT